MLIIKHRFDLDSKNKLDLMELGVGVDGGEGLGASAVVLSA